MFKRFYDGVLARIENAKATKPTAFDWLALITALLPVILSLFENCKNTAVAATRDGKINTLDRARLAVAVRRASETRLTFRESRALADLMSDEAESMTSAVSATPDGKTWVEHAFNELEAIN